MAKPTKPIILNTRPAHQAGPLNALLQSKGADVFNLPTIEIQPTDIAQIKKACEQLHQSDIVIFVSANAAHCSHTYWPTPFPSTHILAIGPGTKKTLEHYGLTQITLPKQFNSQGLLELPILKSVHNKTIMIFCGENSRPTLHDTLSARGGNIILCETYKRLRPSIDAHSISTLKNTRIDAIISTSQESLNNLDVLIGDFPNHFKNTLLIVINAEMAHSAKQIGWKNIAIADNASDHAVMDALTKLKLF